MELKYTHLICFNTHSGFFNVQHFFFFCFVENVLMKIYCENLGWMELAAYVNLTPSFTSVYRNERTSGPKDENKHRFPQILVCIISEFCEFQLIFRLFQKVYYVPNIVQKSLCCANGNQIGLLSEK